MNESAPEPKQHHNPFKGSFAEGGVEVLDLPLNKFYVRPKYWEPGYDCVVHHHLGDLNYKELVTFGSWLLKQPLHPEHANPPVLATLSDVYVRMSRNDVTAVRLIGEDLCILQSNPDVWVVYIKHCIDGRHIFQ